MEYKLIRSSRKTMGLEVKEGELIVRVPIYTTDAEIRALLQKHQNWIEKQLQKSAMRKKALEQQKLLTMEEIRALADKALEVIPGRVRFYAPKVGVTYGKITIRNQRSRWGSCSAKGNLNFNCLLMLAPPEVLDSVVVHELCHRKEMNHSPQFYAEVLRVYPEYRKWDRWLKENGNLLIQRMTGK